MDGKVQGLYNSSFKKEKACGWCAYHKKHLTVKQLKAHNCLQKNCNKLIKYENHEWWRQRALLKEKKKLNKQIMKLII